MYVSNEVRRREIPDTTPDPSQYAAAAHGSNFMAVLSEMGQRPADNPETPPTAGVDGTEKVPAKDVSSSEGDTSEEPKVNKANGDKTAEKVAENENTTATERPSDEGEGAQEISLPAPVVSAAAPDSATPTPVTTPAASMVERSAENAVAPLDAAPTNAISLAKAPPVVSANQAADSIAKDGIAEVAMENVTVEAATASDPPPEAAAVPFPRTLNAIIAEGALRQSADDIGNLETPPKEESKTPSTADAPMPDLPQDLPATQPLPHSAALEVGGVRLQTSNSLPRVPLANLPGELAQQIHMMQQEGATSMRLRVVPENLGDIQIEIHGSGDRLQVRLVSANPVVRDALENQMGDLKNALQKQGLALDNATVGGEAARQNASRQSERQTSAPAAYRTPRTTSEVTVPRSRSIAPAALGSSALNILA